jgi:hypothetical protein
VRLARAWLLTQPVISRAEIPHRSEPLTDPRQSAILPNWLEGQRDAIWSTEAARFHQAYR